MSLLSMPSKPFRPHWLVRGGHIQTILAAVQKGPDLPYKATPIEVQLRDGDRLVMHDDRPPNWREGSPSILLIHGLCGCHTSGYMVRLAARFNGLGVRTFRLDMRGCGAAANLSTSLTHAGRSNDILDVIIEIAKRTIAGPIYAMGVSMGGNQLLRGVGRVGAGEDPLPSDVSERLQRIAAVAPPVDLQKCSNIMQRRRMRFYNWYFIRQLLQRIPPQIRQSEAFQRLNLLPRPKTLRELDARITTPLGGFRDVDDYYSSASAAPYLHQIKTPTLILTSADDPMIPITSFQHTTLADSIELAVTSRGGHVGYISRGTEQWMDDRLVEWFCPQAR
ncbi:putative hydrolase [Roseimaritima multifibrata]|uniref:Putative hydrolase n=1 Tax=Roseimaritima multifibrata TaxID=1930274 RepID=A0A517M9W0_9BACT|nr:alpha/beta fold hydrolase [Roseimaritima multifibrata]QDS91654.1 putative hydrolase [Roseimaritima multifibrata]